MPHTHAITCGFLFRELGWGAEVMLLADMIQRHDSAEGTAHSSSHVKNYYFENMLLLLPLTLPADFCAAKSLKKLVMPKR